MEFIQRGKDGEVEPYEWKKGFTCLLLKQEGTYQRILPQEQEEQE